MSDSLRIAVAGLGTVGAGTVKIIQDNADLIAARSGRRVEVVAVSARDRSRDRGIDLSGMVWYDDPVAMARDAEIDMLVELIGGSDGPAKEACEAALGRGVHVVTANKALVAMHGTALATLAEDNAASLNYEAAVAGGIPIIKALREGLVANNISSIYGILNGTCNYILTTMRETGRDFADVLTEAQALGYAEADPTFDIDGVDAAHKLAILASIAFGAPVNFSQLQVEGIRNVSSMDIELAGELGYRIKLLGIARMTEDGIEQRVHPCMVPVDSSIAQVEGVFNGIEVEGDFVGQSILEGRGAGAGPTASAVVADIVDVAAGRTCYTFGVPIAKMKPASYASPDTHVGPYYIRIVVRDVPGVLADVTAILRDEVVSMDSVLQRGRRPGDTVSVVLTTHEAREDAMMRALEKIAKLDVVIEEPHMIRIQNL